jgi:hypothetical protein
MVVTFVVAASPSAFLVCRRSLPQFSVASWVIAPPRQLFRIAKAEAFWQARNPS